MKPVLILLGLVLLITSCSNSGGGKNAETMAVVERYIDAVKSKNVEAMAALLSDDYIGYGPSFSDSINKSNAIANWKDLTANLYDSIVYLRTVNVTAKITDGPRPGDYVSDWSSLKIKYKDGRGPVYLNVNVIYRIENGKITMSRTFYNEADVLRQLGYEFLPPTQ